MKDLTFYFIQVTAAEHHPKTAGFIKGPFLKKDIAESSLQYEAEKFEKLLKNNEQLVLKLCELKVPIGQFHYPSGTFYIDEYVFNNKTYRTLKQSGKDRFLGVPSASFGVPVKNSVTSAAEE